MAVVKKINSSKKILPKNENFGVLLRQISGDVKRMSGRIDKIDGRIDNMGGEIKRMSGRIDKIDGRIDKIDGRIDKIDGRIDEMGGRIDEMGGDIKRMDGSIDRIIDSHIELDKKVEAIGDDLKDFKNETREGFVNVWREMGSMRQESNANFKELFDFRDETNANFKQVLQCLSVIEDELDGIRSELKRLDENKAEKNAFFELTGRVAKLEQDLENCKILVKDGK